jgi:hypothetical protein
VAAPPAPAAAPPSFAGRVYPPGPSPLADVPPAGPAIAAQVTNDFGQRTATRSFYQDRSTRTAHPQGETQLVHAWLQVITVKKVPPQSCTIWLTRVEPQPSYEFYVPGNAVVGESPDCALYDYLRRCRRQKDVAERFIGRIRAPAVDGSALELGGGECYLPPEPAEPAPAPWSQPGGQAAGWSPYGPYAGAPPPWGWPGAPGMMGMPPMGMGMRGMPWGWGGPATPLAAAIMAQRAPAAPPTVQADPNAMRAWETMSQQNNQMMMQLLEFAMRPQAAPPAAAAPADPWGQLERAVSLVDKLRGPDTSGSDDSGIKVIKLDEETTLVTNKKGDIDATATAFANGKGFKSLLSGLRSLRPGGVAPAGGQAAASAGPRPPGQKTLPAKNTNGTNGAAS